MIEEKNLFRYFGIAHDGQDGQDGQDGKDGQDGHGGLATLLSSLDAEIKLRPLVAMVNEQWTQ